MTKEGVVTEAHANEQLDRASVDRWVADYEDVWRAEGTDRLAELFTDDVAYLASPWREPIRGVEALRGFWEAERDGHDEVFTMSWAIVAVDDTTAVVRVDVEYERGESWRDLWVLQFTDDSRVEMFEEWPFAPDTLDGH